jgi:ubiquitin C-terminal hydrolase
MKYYLVKYDKYIGGVSNKDLNKGGLDNNSQKCYFNSGLQLIYHIIEFRDFLINIQHHYKENSKAWHFIELLRNMKNNTQNTKNFRNLQNETGILCGPEFIFGNQGATDELITKIFESINMKCDDIKIQKSKICKGDIPIKKFKDNDPRSWFTINMTKSIFEKYNNKLITKETNISGIDFKIYPIKPFKNIEVMINQEKNEENILDGDNQYKYEHDKGNLVDNKGKKYDMIDAIMKKQYIFNKYLLIAPQSLIYDYNLNKKVKIFYDYNNIDKQINIDGNKYELIGFVHHTGSAEGGHYICYIYNTDNNSFTAYDDNSVKNNTLPKKLGAVTLVAYRLLNTDYNHVDINLPMEEYFEDITPDIIKTICDLL